ncbi:phospholipid-binding protein, PBP family [Frankineae bacterium MT45]|nr:phospholipid-binding protein, PBP family [Frankineae bacterium MT45]
MSLERAVPPNPYDYLPAVPAFQLTSTDISESEPIGAKFLYAGTADGAQNRSPQLSWSGFPEATRSFAVTCFDPDAPTPSGFWHWAVANLPVGVTSLDTGAGSHLPDLGAALSLRTDWGTKEYGGPQPPEGDRAHRYYFVVHAVDVDALEIDSDVSPAVLSFNLAYHTLARAQLLATYRR